MVNTRKQRTQNGQNHEQLNGRERGGKGVIGSQWSRYGNAGHVSHLRSTRGTKDKVHEPVPGDELRPSGMWSQSWHHHRRERVRKHTQTVRPFNTRHFRKSVQPHHASDILRPSRLMEEKKGIADGVSKLWGGDRPAQKRLAIFFMTTVCLIIGSQWR